MTSLAAVAFQPRTVAAPRYDVEDRMTRRQLYGLALGLDLAGWAAVILFFNMI